MVATTTIVGDVVRQVGGDRIEITTLLPPGADPHSYQARPDDLRKLNGAQVVFMNGLHLEEAMEPTLDSIRERRRWWRSMTASGHRIRRA